MGVPGSRGERGAQRRLLRPRLRLLGRAAAASALEAGFRLSYRDDTAGPVLVDVDRQAFGRALGNLFDNAVKYSGRSRELGVWLDRDGDRVRIGVEDFGIGIPADEQRKIFERFHRVSDGLVHDVRGTGLGLSIVQQIVAAHQGEVTVSSTPGKGSTFIVSLPIAGTAPAGAARGSAGRGDEWLGPARRRSAEA